MDSWQIRKVDLACASNFPFVIFIIFVSRAHADGVYSCHNELWFLAFSESTCTSLFVVGDSLLGLKFFVPQANSVPVEKLQSTQKTASHAKADDASESS